MSPRISSSRSAAVDSFAGMASANAPAATVPPPGMAVFEKPTMIAPITTSSHEVALRAGRWAARSGTKSDPTRALGRRAGSSAVTCAGPASADPAGAHLSPISRGGAQRAEHEGHRAGARVHDALRTVAHVAGAAAAGGELCGAAGRVDRGPLRGGERLRGPGRTCLLQRIDGGG